MFSASGVRWKIGRQLSADETETDKLIPKVVVEKADEDESSSSSSEDESTGDELDKSDELETSTEEITDSQGFEPPAEPKVTQEGQGSNEAHNADENIQSIPLVSFVVDIEDETPDTKRQGIADDEL